METDCSLAVCLVVVFYCFMGGYFEVYAFCGLFSVFLRH